MSEVIKDWQYIKFCSYGFLKNLRFFDAFFILFLVEKGLSYTEIGILYASREISINFLEIPSGIIADTYGRKNSLVFSFISYILSFIWFYYAQHFAEFIGAFLLYGFGDAFRSGTHKGMIMEYLKLNGWKEHKVYYYGHTRSWSQKGSALSSLVAGVAVFYSGSYQYIFLYSIVPYLLNAINIISYPQELNFSKEKDNKKQDLKSTSLSFLNIVKRPHVFKIMSTAALHSAYLKAVKDYIQPLMLQVAILIPFMLEVETDKRTALIIGVIYFLIYLMTSKASLQASRFEAMNKHNISYISLLIGFSCGIACGILWLMKLWLVALVAFIGIYIVQNIRKPILTGAISDNVPNEILTSVISAQALLKTTFTASFALKLEQHCRRLNLFELLPNIINTIIEARQYLYQEAEDQSKKDGDRLLEAIDLNHTLQKMQYYFNNSYHDNSMEEYQDMLKTIRKVIEPYKEIPRFQMIYRFIAFGRGATVMGRLQKSSNALTRHLNNLEVLLETHPQIPLAFHRAHHAKYTRYRLLFLKAIFHFHNLQFAKAAQFLRERDQFVRTNPTIAFPSSESSLRSLQLFYLAVGQIDHAYDKLNELIAFQKRQEQEDRYPLVLADKSRILFYQFPKGSVAERQALLEEIQNQKVVPPFQSSMDLAALWLQLILAKPVDAKKVRKEVEWLTIFGMEIEMLLTLNRATIERNKAVLLAIQKELKGIAKQKNRSLKTLYTKRLLTITETYLRQIA